MTPAPPASRPETPSRKLPRLDPVLILLLVALLAVFPLHDDYGVTLDEGIQATYGELVLAHFRSGFRDLRCDEYLNVKFYGPLFELLPALLYDARPDAKWAIRHLFNALVAWSALPALVLFARRIGAPAVAFWAVLGLLLHPQFVGHAFNNSKDIPAAAAFAWAMAALARLFARRDRSRGAFVEAGLAFGLTMAARPGMLVFLLASTALALAASQWRDRDLPPDLRRAEALRPALALLAATIAWIVLVAPWPWALRDPISRPIFAVYLAVKFHFTLPVLFDGRIQLSDDLPRAYLVKTLFLVTPPFLLALALIGLARVLLARAFEIRDARGGWRAVAARRRPPLGAPFVGGILLLGWALGPILLWTATRSNIYDGMRHFLFILPAWALLFGFAAERLAALVRDLPRRPLPGLAALVFLAAGVGLSVRDHVRLHPFQSSYFTPLVGGLPGAEDRYELDYWRSAYKEAVHWINAQPPARPDGSTRVLVAANDFTLVCASAHAAPHLRLVVDLHRHPVGDLPPEFDYHLSAPRVAQDPALADAPLEQRLFRPDRNFPDAPVVHVISRDGAVLALVRARRDLPSPARADPAPPPPPRPPAPSQDPPRSLQ